MSNYPTTSDSMKYSNAEERTEGVMWSMRDDVSSGVLRVTNNKVTVLIRNMSNKAMILNKGDEIRGMGTKKKLTK